MGQPVTEPPDERLRYLSVELTAAGVAEIDGDRRTVLVPRTDIEQVELCHGAPGERPVFEVLFGSVLILVGVIALRIVLAWREHGGAIPVKLAAGIGSPLFGLWMLWSALRPKYFLRVKMRRDTRKIRFQGGRVDPKEIERLLARANRLYGYGITTALPGFDLAGTPSP